MLIFFRKKARIDTVAAAIVSTTRPAVVNTQQNVREQIQAQQQQKEQQKLVEIEDGNFFLPFSLFDYIFSFFLLIYYTFYTFSFIP